MTEQPEQSIEDIESKLASLDFDAPAEPAGEAEPQEAGETEAQAEPAGEAEASQPAEPDDDPETTLRDGRRVKLSELKRGYVPEYEQKLAEFKQREQAFGQATAGFSQAQQEMVRQLQHAVQYVGSQMPKPPATELAQTDPFAYMQQKAAYDQKAAELNQLVVARNQTMARYQQQQAFQHKRYLAQQMEATLNKLPDLKDPVKRAKWMEGVNEMAAEAGYSRAELSQVNDARLFWIINEALQNRQNKKALETAKAKQATLKADLAKAQTPVQAPSRRRTTAEVAADGLRARMKQLAKTPNSIRAQEDALSSPAWEGMHQPR